MPDQSPHHHHAKLLWEEYVDICLDSDEEPNYHGFGAWLIETNPGPFTLYNPTTTRYV